MFQRGDRPRQDLSHQAAMLSVTVIQKHVLSTKNNKVDIIIETNTNFANKWLFNCCQWGQLFRYFFFNIFCVAKYTFYIFLAIKESVTAFT